MTGKYQRFYERWRESSSSSRFINTFPYKLPLGMDPIGTALVPFGPLATSGAQILITKAYDNMFHRILCLRAIDNGTNRGAVITGQPGVGVSR